MRFSHFSDARATISEDGDFDPETRSLKPKKRNRQSLNIPEEPRADLYVLKENHDHLFSSSFEASFHGSRGADLSSSQPDAAFDFGDDFLKGLDGFDLSNELGPGWGGSPLKAAQE